MRECRALLICRTLLIAALQIVSASALANASSHAVANLYTNTSMNLYTNTSMNDGDGPDKGGLQYPDPGQGYPPTVPDGKLPGQEQQEQQGGESRTRLHALRAQATRLLLLQRLEAGSPGAKPSALVPFSAAGQWLDGRSLRSASARVAAARSQHID